MRADVSFVREVLGIGPRSIQGAVEISSAFAVPPAKLWARGPCQTARDPFGKLTVKPAWEPEAITSAIATARMTFEAP
jgi:hypothetical protein